MEGREHAAPTRVWIVMRIDDWPWFVYTDEGAANTHADAVARARAETAPSDMDRDVALRVYRPAVLTYDTLDRFDPAGPLTPEDKYG